MDGEQTQQNQEDNGENHDDKGRFLPGNLANPEGKNGHMRGFQPYGIRAAYWLGKLSAEGLRELANDKKAFGNLSSYDAIIVRHLVGCIAGKDIGFERDRLLDRIEGKAKNRTELSGPDGGAIRVGQIDPEVAAREVSEMLADLARTKASYSREAQAMACGGEAGADSTSG